MEKIYKRSRQTQNLVNCNLESKNLSMYLCHHCTNSRQSSSEMLNSVDIFWPQHITHNQKIISDIRLQVYLSMHRPMKNIFSLLKYAQFRRSRGASKIFKIKYFKIFKYSFLYDLKWACLIASSHDWFFVFHMNLDQMD